jgi:hypothetical protein
MKGGSSAPSLDVEIRQRGLKLFSIARGAVDPLRRSYEYSRAIS